MKSLIDYYDDFAQEWADEWYNNEKLLPYLKEFVSMLPKNSKVLDLCCGAGYESMRLKNLGVNVVGADLSEKSIKIAKEKNPDIEFFVKDMLKSYKDLGMFDGITCIAGIVHINEENLDLAFRNMYEVIKQNGYLLLVVRDGSGVRETLEKDNQVYARKFICYTLEKLNLYMEKYFEFIKELPTDSDWKYYIFKRKN